MGQACCMSELLLLIVELLLEVMLSSTTQGRESMGLWVIVVMRKRGAP